MTSEDERPSAKTELPYSLQGKRVWVAGHRGMVGSAIVRRLERENCEILTCRRSVVDLTRQDQVEEWMLSNKPQAIFVAAAKVGGILDNSTYPADYLYDNLSIEMNIINAAWRTNTEKLLFLGSSCIYPKFAPQPITEDALLTGPLEPTNEWYAVAKIAGIRLCQAYREQYNCDFISGMPTNLYGPGDNFDLLSSHVIPALIRKAHEAKIRNDNKLVIWGSGSPLREFLHVDDCADAIVHVMTNYSQKQHINIGSGTDLSILDLAQNITSVVGFKGEIVTDTSKPDGTPRKLMSATKLEALGWKPRINLTDGLRNVYQWYLKECDRTE